MPDKKRLKRKIKEMRAERREFIEALQFYAGGSHYDTYPVEDGLTARKALSHVRNKKRSR